MFGFPKEVAPEMGAHSTAAVPQVSLTDWISQAQAHARARAEIKDLIDREAEAVVLSLARSLEARDPHTEGHCERLGAYASMLGEQIGVSPEHVRALELAGIIHDVGKVTMPDSILLKPGPLDDEERRIMQQHPVVGEHICRPLKAFEIVLPIIRHHHERMDGTGYPDGLRGEQIPFTARILQVVDVYDALTMDRPYREALASEHALEVMREEAKRGWLDPEIVQHLEWLAADLQAEARCLELCANAASKLLT